MSRRGNPNWAEGKGAKPVPNEPSRWELLVARLGVPEAKWSASPELRRFAEQNCRSRFVPEKLLETWHLEVSDEID